MTTTATPLAHRLVDASLAVRADALPAAIVDKVRVCLQDAIGCACETSSRKRTS